MVIIFNAVTMQWSSFDCDYELIEFPGVEILHHKEINYLIDLAHWQRGSIRAVNNQINEYEYEKFMMLSNFYRNHSKKLESRLEDIYPKEKYVKAISMEGLFKNI